MILICFQFIQHIINRYFDSPVCLVLHCFRELNFINEQEEPISRTYFYKAFNVFAEHDLA
ncbi:MAG: hypothetical protein K5927_04490 [Lachnospiraceae bacterium]|nr:hypothetical protein [Lachnospiraceae bacterium]